MSAADAMSFDPDALRQRYREERDLRLRPDGNEQYLQIAGELSAYGVDPYLSEVIEREPLAEEVEVVIIGGGFGGLIAAARLKQQGIEDVRIVEKGGDFGGTWYWNRYPGAQCDIEAYVYLPLLEELGVMPTEKYAHQPEIQSHASRIGQHFGLYDRALFQTRVTGLDWDESQGRWRVATDREDALMARYVLMSTGPLNQPKLPGIPGVDTFQGHSFHTSRWDYDYTGGDTTGGLARLADKRVAIIGTGATAVQCVPHLAEGAEHLYVFQRTPSSIDERGNSPTDPDWVSQLEPGWHQHRIENFSATVTGQLTGEDLVSDGWTDLFRKLIHNVSRSSNPDLSPEGIARAIEMADFEKMEEIRARAEVLVEDPGTAESLKPWYRQFCKRPCFHDGYLAAFNRDNVTLVDTRGQGVDRITESAVVADGVEYPVDCIIFATGFEVGTGFIRRTGYDVRGVGGKALAEKWGEGLATLHGITSHGFPNCFFLGNTQAGFSPNFCHMLDENARQIGYLINEAAERGATRVEATEDGENNWVQTCVDKVMQVEQFQAECTPGYYNNEGKPGERRGQDGWYGGGCVEYWALLDAWRKAGECEGVAFS